MLHIKYVANQFLYIFLSLVKYRYFCDMYRHIKLILICRARCRRASNRLDRIYATLWKSQGYLIDSTFEGNVMLILTFTMLWIYKRYWNIRRHSLLESLFWDLFFPETLYYNIIISFVVSLIARLSSDFLSAFVKSTGPCDLSRGIRRNSCLMTYMGT